MTERKADPASRTVPKTGRLRLFFATWLPDRAARALHHWAREVAGPCGGRVLPAANLHMTLAFLGDIAAERLPAAVAAARRVKFGPHTIRVARANHRARGRIVWAAPDETPALLTALAADLSAELVAARFELEKRAFVAHVTLIRSAPKPRALPPLPAVEWSVTEFVLARSTLTETGSRYEIVERFDAPAPAHQ